VLLRFWAGLDAKGCSPECAIALMQQVSHMRIMRIFSAEHRVFCQPLTCDSLYGGGHAEGFAAFDAGFLLVEDPGRGASGDRFTAVAA
jgi:hypothetical protein